MFIANLFCSHSFYHIFLPSPPNTIQNTTQKLHLIWLVFKPDLPIIRSRVWINFYTLKGKNRNNDQCSNVDKSVDTGARWYGEKSPLTPIYIVRTLLRHQNKWPNEIPYTTNWEQLYHEWYVCTMGGLYRGWTKMVTKNEKYHRSCNNIIWRSEPIRQ